MAKKKEVLSLKELKHKTRRLSIKEGIFWTVRQGFGDRYISPFAIAIGASNPIVALINTIWSLSSATQIFGTNLIKKFSRKKILITTMLVNSLCFLLLGLIGFLYIKSIATQILPILIFIDILLMVWPMGMGHPAWFSWMGEMVDPKFRGRWWAKRSTIITFTSIIFTIASSFILESFKNHGLTILGFTIFFVIASIARFYCSRIIKKQYEPKTKKEKKENFNLRKFSKSLVKTNFGRFILFRGLFAMAIMLTSPLVSIYLLRDLGLNYPVYIFIALSGMIFSVFTLNFWGKLADKFGNYRIIAISTFLVPLNPILWIFSTSKIYLFLVPGIIGGIGWYGFILASKNFIYDNVSKKDRAKSVAYVNLFIGMGALIGGLISTLLIKSLHTSWIQPIILIFLIGTIVRMIIVGIFVPKIKEVKHKRKIKGVKEFEQLLEKEAGPTLTEDFHEIISIKNYIRD